MVRKRDRGSIGASLCADVAPCGPLAQLAEQQTLNLRVDGSIPSRLTTLRSPLPRDRELRVASHAKGGVHRSGAPVARSAEVGGREGGRSVAIPASFSPQHAFAICSVRGLIRHTPPTSLRNSSGRGIALLPAWPRLVGSCTSSRASVIQPVLYTGLTSNVRLRLAEHNGRVRRHTANGRPWKVIVVVAFASQRRAISSRSDLKSGSGFAFAVRHFR